MHLFTLVYTAMLYLHLINSIHSPILTYSEKERDRESESERYLQTNKILHDEFRQQMMFYLELHLLIDL